MHFFICCLTTLYLCVVGWDRVQSYPRPGGGVYTPMLWVKNSKIWVDRATRNEMNHQVECQRTSFDGQIDALERFEV